MKANLLLLLLTIQTHQICSYTTDMPDNGTEEMVTQMPPNMPPLVTNMPNGQTTTQNMPDRPVSSGYVPHISDNQTGSDAQNQTLGKTRSDIFVQNYCYVIDRKKNKIYLIKFLFIFRVWRSWNLRGE